MASIKKRHRPDCSVGKCECSWRLDYRPLGVRGPRKRLFFDTKKQAERYLAETSHKVTRGEYIDPTKAPTFNEAAERWFISKSDRRPSHVSNLRSRLDKHILPRIGAKRLNQINVGTIEELRDGLRNDGYAARTIKSILRLVGAVFRSAIRRGECVTNPVDRVEPVFVAARELKVGGDERASEDDVVSPDSILSPQEIRAMLNATTPGLYRALFTTAALTGARSGELFALRWSDVEMPKDASAYVYIRRTLSWARLKGEEIRPRYYEPKTKAGVRKIPVSAELASVLRAWKLQCSPTPDGLVFPTHDGRPIRRSNALRYGLWPALRRAGLRRVTMHSLRHSFASALIMAGAAVTEVQALLGHASPEITLRIYSHWFKKIDSGAVARLSETVLGKAGIRTEAKTEWAKSGHSDDSAVPRNAVNA